MADERAVTILALLLYWLYLAGLGLILRRFARRWFVAELIMWAYLVMGTAATYPHYWHRAGMNTRNFPGPPNASYFLLAVPPDFALMSLTWPLLEYILLIAPVVDPAQRGRLYAEILTAVAVTAVLAPILTFGLRRWDRRSSSKRPPR